MNMLLIQLNCDGFWSWPWAWPILLAFILGFILGWLLSRILGKTNANETDYRAKYLDTKADLELCQRDAKTDLDGAKGLNLTSDDDDSYKNQYLALQTEFDNYKSNAITTKPTDGSVKDDLTKVEGIGPKINGLLNDDGIFTWQQLSDVAVERIQKVLDDAGPRYRIHHPESWPLQSGMCARGEWDKLKKWQDEHKKGRL